MQNGTVPQKSPKWLSQAGTENESSQTVAKATALTTVPFPLPAAPSASMEAAHRGWGENGRMAVLQDSFFFTHIWVSGVLKIQLLSNLSPSIILY